MNYRFRKFVTNIALVYQACPPPNYPAALFHIFSSGQYSDRRKHFQNLNFPQPQPRMIQGVPRIPRMLHCRRFLRSPVLQMEIRRATVVTFHRQQLQKLCPLNGNCRIVRRVAVSLTILGSGSAGNCAYLETGETRILIDAGFSGRQVRLRLAQIGRVPETLHGILITHEHSDHIQGLVQLSSKLRIPIYCNRQTQEAIEQQLDTAFDCRLFATGATFEIGDVAVDSFPVPHDAQDPVGFLIRTPKLNVGLLTDLGCATKLALERIRAAHVLILEANHDQKLLQEDSRRPWSLKQRILSRHGHLCNEAAADVAEQVVSADLRHLYLAHLSRDCNRPELALKAVGGRLARLGATHVNVHTTSQDIPSPTLTFCEEAAGGTPCQPQVWP
jgi:phosphoribosyl 1,2-cyclic phosphodiesterase